MLGYGYQQRHANLERDELDIDKFESNTDT
jgi:hypothetical protein